MSWYNPVTWFFGDDADTYAANVAAQWRLLEKTAQTADPAAWQRAYDLVVSYYGPPATTEAQILENARRQYMADIDKAADQGFVEGAGKAVDSIVIGTGDAFSAVWGKIPAAVKWGGLAVLGLWIISTLTNAMQTFQRPRARRK